MASERVCVLEKGDSGYGFHLHSEKTRPGQYVRLVEPGSAAEKAGLRAGDRLIRVCGEDVRELGHQQVVSKIRAATEKLTLEVQGVEEEVAPSSPKEENKATEKQPTPVLDRKELRPRLCTIKKGPSGFGFNLHSDKDRIVEVNGLNVIGKQHGDVVAAIKAGGDETSLLVLDPEADSYFKECNVVPGKQHLTGPLPEKLANGGLEKLNNSEEQIHPESPLSSPEPAPDMVTPKLEAQKDSSENTPAPASDATSPTEPVLDLNMSLALAKERAHQKRSQKKAPSMDWSKKKEVFSSL
uniref:Na(+)/H(+) exchange regulatory cofactor NHE-RF1 n=1 Tax=Xenopus tropicalis TaxID=8364 RepID=A0A803JUC5_XENTR